MMDPRSTRNLEDVHPDLVSVIQKTFESLAPESHLTFKVTEGVRDKERQLELYNTGKSRTLKSRHVPDSNECKMSCAVDLVAIVEGQVSWDMKYYATLSLYVKAAAAELKIPVEWGGDWKSFKDGPHFQLSEVAYPMKK